MTDEVKPSRPRNVAEYLYWQIHLCGKSQLQIAEECGFNKPNVITMFKQGRTKLPLDKVAKMATAIGVDPVFLFKLCMAEYMPEAWAEMQRVFDQPMLTANEREFIEVIRNGPVMNPKLDGDIDRARFAEFLGTLKDNNGGGQDNLPAFKYESHKLDGKDLPIPKLDVCGKAQVV